MAELYSAGDSQQVVAYGEQALALARHLGLKELMGLVLNDLCWPFGTQKHLEQSRQALNEAQAIWRELGNLLRLAEVCRFMLIIHCLLHPVFHRVDRCRLPLLNLQAHRLERTYAV